MRPEDQQNHDVATEMRQFRIGPAVVCKQQRTVTIDGERHVATDLSWRFLMVLVDAAPDIVSYEALRSQVWEHSAVSDETMAQRARQVRQMLGDDPKDPVYIRTIRGKGYQLIATPEPLAIPSGRSGSETNTGRNRIAVRLVFVAIVIAAGFWWVSREPSSEERSIPAATPQVAELLERANEYVSRGQKTANELAIELYGEALQLEPDNEDALVGLSFALSHRPSKYEASNEWALEAAELADRALLMNAENANAWAARGLADDARGRVALAMQYYQRAYDLSPNSNLLASIAYLLQVQGRLHEALVMESRALSAAPPTFFADYQIAVALDLAGLQSAATAWFERAERLRPDNVFLVEYKARQLIKNSAFENALQVLENAGNERFGNLELRGIAYLANEQPDAAREAFAAALAVTEDAGSQCLACVAALLQPEEKEDVEIARELLTQSEEVMASGDEWPEFRVKLAYLQTSLDDHDAALSLLDDAFMLGYRDWRWLEVSPLLAALRSNAGYQSLIESMKTQANAERDLITADASLAPMLDNVRGD